MKPDKGNIRDVEEWRSKWRRVQPLGRDGNGGLWIDPHTHRIRRTLPNGSMAVSERIYAVGAMTRGQIIDASMAHGSAVSTETIARDWVDYVFS